jgi:hypothetical protein
MTIDKTVFEMLEGTDVLFWTTKQKKPLLI